VYRKSPNFKLKWSFSIGEATIDPGSKQWAEKGYKGFTRHPFQKTLFVLKKSIKDRILDLCRSDEELEAVVTHAHALASEIFSGIDPSYTDGEYNISFSCMDSENHHVRKHSDSRDICYQYMLGLGDYEGRANICIGDKEINYNSRILKVDVRNQHYVVQKDFKGTRYSVIAYKIYDRRFTKEAQRTHSPEIVFTMEKAKDTCPINTRTDSSPKKATEIRQHPISGRSCTKDVKYDSVTLNSNGGFQMSSKRKRPQSEEDEEEKEIIPVERRRNEAQEFLSLPNAPRKKSNHREDEMVKRIIKEIVTESSVLSNCCMSNNFYYNKAKLQSMSRQGMKELVSYYMFSSFAEPYMSVKKRKQGTLSPSP
jgi:hypothetical protein